MRSHHEHMLHLASFLQPRGFVLPLTKQEQEEQREMERQRAQQQQQQQRRQQQPRALKGPKGFAAQRMADGSCPPATESLALCQRPFWLSADGTVHTPARSGATAQLLCADTSVNAGGSSPGSAYTANGVLCVSSKAVVSTTKGELWMQDGSGGTTRPM